MIKKELLVVYNMFGGDEFSVDKYVEEISAIFWHIKEHNLQNTVRVVVSSVLNTDDCIEELKNTFIDEVVIFRYENRIPVQVSFNKTVLTALEFFNEDYNGYFYISAGIQLTQITDLFPRIIEKNNSGEYGIIHLHVDTDADHHQMYPEEHKNIDFQEDYVIPIKHFCNFHVAVINKDIKNFFGVPHPDVWGRCGMEPVLSYVCSSLRKRYILLGNSYCIHSHTWNNMYKTNSFIFKGAKFKDITCGLLWGRTPDIIKNDVEAIESGLGYWAGKGDTYFRIEPNLEKYDDQYLSTDNRLKYGVKRCYFTNKTEVDYDTINYIIK